MKVMKHVAAGLLCALALRAEPVLLVHDATGALLRQAPAVLRTQGKALAPREALYGAASALLLDDRHVLHTVAWITAEDRDSGVVELFVGRQAPAGPDAATGPATETRSAGHAARAGEYRELGGYGMVARLTCAGGGNEVSGPLYDQHGFLAGWHAVRVVDGQTLAFALPLARLQEGLAEMAPVSVAQWNRRRRPEADEVYAQAMGHVWAGDFEGAAYYWRKASEAEPENARVWYQLAFMEGKTGHSQAKTRCFRKAIALQPDFAEAHYNLGIGLALAGDREGALEEVKALRPIDESLARRLEGFLGVEHTDQLPGQKSGSKPAARSLARISRRDETSIPDRGENRLTDG